jgi:hypothetical protein
MTKESRQNLRKQSRTSEARLNLTSLQSDVTKVPIRRYQEHWAPEKDKIQRFHSYASVHFQAWFQRFQRDEKKVNNTDTTKKIGSFQKIPLNFWAPNVAWEVVKSQSRKVVKS